MEAHAAASNAVTVALPSAPLSPTGHECITLHARIDMRCTAREYPRTLPLGPSHMA
jgi:hypothetical protein